MRTVSPIAAALAAVVHLLTLAGLAFIWRRQQRAVDLIDRQVTGVATDLNGVRSRLDQLRTDVDSRLAAQAWRQAFGDVRGQSTGRAARRHLASVTALPCPKGYTTACTPGGDQ